MKKKMYLPREFRKTRNIMEIQTVSHSSTDEQTIIAIMRRLPLNRKEQIVSFARFIEYDTFNEPLPKTSASQSAKPLSEKETLVAALPSPPFL